MSWLSDQTGTNVDATGGAGSVDYMPGISSGVNQLFGSGVGVEGGKSAGAPEIPKIDPRLEEIKKNQMDQAKKFRSQLGDYKEEQYRGATSQARRAMAGKIQSTKGAYADHGLLNSGARQAAEAEQAGKVFGSLAEERAGISQDLNSAADLYDQQALKSELAINEAQADISRQLYDRAIAERMAKRGALGGLFQAIGSIGGAAAAKG